MNTSDPLTQLAERSASTPFPTAADIVKLPVRRKPDGAGGRTDTIAILCRGKEIGRLQTAHFRATGPNKHSFAIESTLRVVDGATKDAISGHDIGWLLQEHIEHDLGGKQQRLAAITPGRTFFAPETIVLDPRDLRETTNWFIPPLSRLAVTAINDERVTFRWDVRYAPRDLMPRRDFINGTTDSLPLSTFQHLVGERLLKCF